MRPNSITINRDVITWLLVVTGAIAAGILSAWKDPFLPIGATLAAVVAVSVLVNLKFGLILLVGSYFYVRPLLYLPFSNLTYLRADDIAWLLVTLSWILNIRKHKLHALRRLPLTRSIFVFFVIAFFSIFRVAMVTVEAQALQNSIWFVLRLFQYFSVYFIFGTLDLTPQDRTRLFSSILFFGLIVSMIGLLQYGDVLPAFEPTRHVAAEGRLSGTFTFKAEIGAMMLVLILLVVNKMTEHKFNQIVGLIFLGVFSVVLVFTESRSAWLATLVAIAVYLLSLRKASVRMYWLIAILSVGIIVVGSDTIQQIYTGRPIIDFSTGRIAQDFAVQSRLYGYTNSLLYILVRPDILFFGVGFMNWRYALYSYSLIYSGHNNFLTALGELGLVGLAGFCNLLIQAIRAAWRQAAAAQPHTRFYLALLVGLVVAACFEDIFWPAAALESFLAFIMMISAISLQLTRENSPADTGS